MHDQMTRPSDYERVKALTNAWNKGDLKVGKNITKNEAEMLAANAYTKGLDFDVESKPLKKFAFNLANTATFGLLPDSIFKPDPSIGEMYHGENWSDYLAGGAGSLLGLIGGGYGLVKGAGAVGGRAVNAWNNWRSRKNAKDVFNASMVGDELALLGTRNIPLLGKGAPRLGPKQAQLPGRPLELPRAYGSYGDTFKLPSLKGPNSLPPSPVPQLPRAYGSYGDTFRMPSLSTGSLSSIGNAGAPNLLQLAGRRNYGADIQSVIDNMTRSGYIA